MKNETCYETPSEGIIEQIILMPAATVQGDLEIQWLDLHTASDPINTAMEPFIADMEEDAGRLGSNEELLLISVQTKPMTMNKSMLFFLGQPYASEPQGPLRSL